MNMSAPPFPRPLWEGGVFRLALHTYGSNTTAKALPEKESHPAVGAAMLAGAAPPLAIDNPLFW